MRFFLAIWLVIGSFSAYADEVTDFQSSYQEFHSYLKSKRHQKKNVKEIISRFKESFSSWEIVQYDHLHEWHAGIIGSSYCSHVYELNPHLTVGPGLGYVNGKELIACTHQTSYEGVNAGVSLSAIVVRGMTVGLYAGQNGFCTRLHIGKGFMIGGGVSFLKMKDRNSDHKRSLEDFKTGRIYGW